MSESIVIENQAIGVSLKAARDDNGLSIAEVAKSLNLNKQVIQSIEDDKFEGFTSKLYLKGYLRAYAKLLNIPFDPLMVMFDKLPIAETKKTKFHIPIEHGQGAAKSRSKEGSKKSWFLYAVVGGVVILIGGSWLLYKQTASELRGSGAMQQISTPLSHTTHR